MNAIDMIKEDHQKVKSLFRDFEQAGEGAHKKKQDIAEKVFEELTVHSRLEEEIFYPAVREKSSAEDKHLVAEAVEEHHVVDLLIEELKKLSPEDEQFTAKFTVLIENVEHHIEEEEEDMLPDAEDILGDELDEIGEKMERRKKEIMQEV
ncbi:MAG: hemerythrin domain-containing protein [Dehalococcoidia bacterium]